jgi:hypothetical protein
MKSVKKTLALIVLLSLSVLIPITVAYARRVQDPVRIFPTEVVFLEDNSELMPNGFLKVDWTLEMIWERDGVKLGDVTQYVSGIMRTDGKATLRGGGVFTSSDPLLPGTITYASGNNFGPPGGPLWAFRMRIVGGTGSFEGIQGSSTADGWEWLFHLNFNPWG